MDEAPTGRRPWRGGRRLEPPPLRATAQGGELLYRALDGAPFGAIVASTQPDGRCLYLNSEFTAITGYTLQDMPTVADWLAKAYPDPDYRAMVVANWPRDVDPGNMNRDVLYEIVCRDGTRKSIQFRASDLGPGLMFVMLLDVTDRERTRRALEVRDQAIHACIDAIAFADLDGRLTYVNPAFVSMWHCRNEEDAVGRSVADFWTERPAAEAAMSALLRRGYWIGELQGRRRDGTTFDAWVSASVARSGDGKPLTLLAWFLDLSDRRRAETAMAHTRSQLDAAIESLPFDFFAIDADGRYFLQNSICRRHWGHVIGKRPDDMAANDAVRAIWRENNRRAFAGETVDQEVEYEVGGRRRAIHNILSPIRVDGRVDGILGINIDVTEQRRAERDRLAMAARLRHSERMEAIGQLAGGLAHDFNNILTAISGNTELLAAEVTGGGRPQALVAQIARAAGQAAGLTAKLLTFARRGKVAAVPVNVHEAVAAARDLLARSIDRRIEIVLELGAADPVIRADGAQIQTALLNLGLNARDAMPDGGRLTFATRDVSLQPGAAALDELGVPPGRYVEIDVADTGCGIAPDHMPRVFEPFFTTKEPGKGTGLGLASVYGSVKSHGGGIRVRSTQGVGTTFTIVLPAPPVAAPVPGADAASPEPVRGTGHILVVDDEPLVRELTRDALSGLGYTVSTCCDGLEAVEFYAAHHAEVDAVLLDLVMPRMDGAGTFRRLRRIDPQVRVLLFSGYEHNSSAASLLAEGARGFLNKPFRIAELSHRIAACLASAEGAPPPGSP